jgi:hypothetical protein
MPSLPSTVLMKLSGPMGEEVIFVLTNWICPRHMIESIGVF